MNRSFTVFAGVASIALALVLSTQISTSAQINTSAKISAPAKISTAANQKHPHRLAVQVDVNDPAVMNLALNNVSNVAQHYSEIGHQVEIEVVAFGPGLHMLRDDTSPVKARIKSMSETMPQRHIPNSITTMRRRLSVALISQTDQRRRNGWHELAGHIARCSSSW